MLISMNKKGDIMSEHTVNYQLNTYDDRNEVRMAVVNEFLKEEPGQGKGDLASKYTYYVETLSDGNRIFLRRSDNIHNGFDFVVGIENVNNPEGRKRSYPKHDDIISNLENKKQENVQEYKKLYTVLEKVYNCTLVTEDEMNFNFKSGYSTELIIKTLKWLFIEQDIRYWNYSGRDMLWDSIKMI